MDFWQLLSLILASLDAGTAESLNTQQVVNAQLQAALQGATPGFLGNLATSETRQLSPAFVNAIKNMTQGSIGQAGLADSPALVTSIMAQALAPYQLQEQQMGEQLALSGWEAPFRMPVSYPSYSFSSDMFGTSQGGTGTGPNPFGNINLGNLFGP